MGVETILYLTHHLVPLALCTERFRSSIATLARRPSDNASLPLSNTTYHHYAPFPRPPFAHPKRYRHALTPLCLFPHAIATTDAPPNRLPNESSNRTRTRDARSTDGSGVFSGTSRMAGFRRECCLYPSAATFAERLTKTDRSVRYCPYPLSRSWLHHPACIDRGHRYV